MYPDPARTVFGHKTLTYFEKDMSLYLSRPGVMPILIPDLRDEEFHQFVSQMDGFVFQGGADLAPQSYGETPIENGRWPGDRHRDQYELKIMDYAFQNRKPFLCICRGFQVMNVYFGGTLFQDLAIQTKTSVVHRDAEKYDRISHSVTLSTDSLFYRTNPELKGKREMTVNTVHHQGVNKLGRGLVIDATSTQDQLVEAFHYQNLEEQFAVGVQWHPEFSHTLGNQVVNPHPLYDFFLSAVRYKKEK